MVMQAAESKIEKQIESKTKELRDWLNAEIECASEDKVILENSLSDIAAGRWRPPAGAPRYFWLTSDEREAKVVQDRKKLEELKKRLELLRYARELDVDIDALEKAGVRVSRMTIHEAAFECYFRVGDVHCEFRIVADTRHFFVRCYVFEFGIEKDIFSYAHYSVVSFNVQKVLLSFEVQKPPIWMNENRFVLTLPPYDYYLLVRY